MQFNHPHRVGMAVDASLDRLDRAIADGWSEIAQISPAVRLAISLPASIAVLAAHVLRRCPMNQKALFVAPAYAPPLVYDIFEKGKKIASSLAEAVIYNGMTDPLAWPASPVTSEAHGIISAGNGVFLRIGSQVWHATEFPAKGWSQGGLQTLVLRDNFDHRHISLAMQSSLRLEF
ncbi:MAG: hypothetical protein KGI75_30415 [Rhizobiaceae bacterium]|nr:hypothetical protein [Rhizobiaceae bacterium]